MSSFQSTVPSNSNFDENRWVIQIRRSFDEVHEEDAEIPVNIFSVPKILMASDPNSYVPQQIALGPYHYWRPELYEMERYKIGAAKRAQKQLNKCLKFQHLVDHLKELDPKIRACYHRYLDFNSETLAWMMAVDASFLLEVLQVYAVKDGKMLTRVTSRMSHLVDFARRKSAHNTILRDIAMLENQIPLFVLQETLKFQFDSLELANEMLATVLIGLCEEVSPFKNMGELPNIQVSKRAHVLDLLYHMIVPKGEEGPENDEGEDQSTEAREGEGETFGKPSHVRQLGNVIWKILSKLNKGPVRLLKKLLLSKPIKVFIKLPWKIVSNLPGIRILKKPINNFFVNEDKEDDKPENEDSNNNTNKPPLVEEISIPSVTELLKSGVCFVAAEGGINAISFDVETFKFYLPVVSLDVNTEVILRNLVAYEACSASGPLVFTRYTELMNGIIDTVEDAKLLREKGIILNRLKRDEEVADLWNGMSKSLRLTKVPFLDKVIEDVNKFHSGRWRVKVGKFMKVYVFGSWQFLTFMAAILMLLLMTLQAFCSVYRCGRIFDHVPNIQ